MKTQYLKQNETAKTQTNATQWGETPGDNFGYSNESDRHNQRGLEDWEMVATMETKSAPIPYWFMALFLVLLLVAIGLTFPFWGNRPGYERDWFDWGIPAGVAWVIVMSFVIFYFVDLRHTLADRRKAREEAATNERNEEADDSNEL